MLGPRGLFRTHTRRTVTLKLRSPRCSTTEASITKTSGDQHCYASKISAGHGSRYRERCKMCWINGGRFIPQCYSGRCPEDIPHKCPWRPDLDLLFASREVLKIQDKIQSNPRKGCTWRWTALSSDTETMPPYASTAVLRALMGVRTRKCC